MARSSSPAIGCSTERNSKEFFRRANPQPRLLKIYVVASQWRRQESKQVYATCTRVHSATPAATTGPITASICARCKTTLATAILGTPCTKRALPVGALKGLWKQEKGLRGPIAASSSNRSSCRADGWSEPLRRHAARGGTSS
jgi:hypothetical protein